jgi:hypothetical protein
MLKLPKPIANNSHVNKDNAEKSNDAGESVVRGLVHTFH